jgi:gamma-glutamylcyclotransferase (GGCT)/AIG2-like uncharacterized protein YtfP
VFVYGTLRPGDVRWRFLEPFVVGGGAHDTAPGSLYDTLLDYPAAVFHEEGTIHGETFEIRHADLEDCLAVLDVEEDTVGGLYRRVSLTTGRGTRVWAYEYGQGLDLVHIPSGDWFEHRPPLTPGEQPTAP